MEKANEKEIKEISAEELFTDYIDIFFEAVTDKEEIDSIKRIFFDGFWAAMHSMLAIQRLGANDPELAQKTFEDLFNETAPVSAQEGGN